MSDQKNALTRCEFDQKFCGRMQVRILLSPHFLYTANRNDPTPDGIRILKYCDIRLCKSYSNTVEKIDRLERQPLLKMNKSFFHTAIRYEGRFSTRPSFLNH